MNDEKIEQEWKDGKCLHESNGNEYSITRIGTLCWRKGNSPILPKDSKVETKCIKCGVFFDE